MMKSVKILAPSLRSHQGFRLDFNDNDWCAYCIHILQNIYPRSKFDINYLIEIMKNIMEKHFGVPDIQIDKSLVDESEINASFNIDWTEPITNENIDLFYSKNVNEYDFSEDSDNVSINSSNDSSSNDDASVGTIDDNMDMNMNMNAYNDYIKNKIKEFKQKHQKKKKKSYKKGVVSGKQHACILSNIGRYCTAIRWMGEVAIGKVKQRYMLARFIPWWNIRWAGYDLGIIGCIHNIFDIGTIKNNPKRIKRFVFGQMLSQYYMWGNPLTNDVFNNAVDRIRSDFVQVCLYCIFICICDKYC